jgi:hypothetical protein
MGAHVKVGDKIRVLTNYPLCANLRGGDIGVVIEITDRNFKVKSKTGTWNMGLGYEGEHWEKVIVNEEVFVEDTILSF